MSVMKGPTIVMRVPPVLTVPVTLDSLGMVLSVRVRVTALVSSTSLCLLCGMAHNYYRSLTAETDLN